jgi:hypothetical protein|tara:strand:+ start:372 stop:533 length:162 start_codon:yes stop_codon:yes gene_type:complete
MHQAIQEGKGMYLLEKFATMAEEAMLASGVIESSQLMLLLFFLEYFVDEYFRW